MPLLSVKTSIPTPEAATVTSLLQELSAKVAQHLSKPESYVMTCFEVIDFMTFGGTDDQPVAYLELKSIGSFTPSSTESISADLCRILEEKLGVPPARTYIEFVGCERHLWGWNGKTFA